jgi:hypothetical protein
MTTAMGVRVSVPVSMPVSMRHQLIDASDIAAGGSKLSVFHEGVNGPVHTSEYYI